MFSCFFLQYHSRRAKVRHATAIRTKRSTSELICTVDTQRVQDKAIRDVRAVKTPCPGILTAICCPQQTRAMSACFGLSQGDLESEYPHCTAVITCWCSLSEKLFTYFISFFFHPIYYPCTTLALRPSAVRASQCLRKEHAANMWPSPCWPWMLG